MTAFEKAVRAFRPAPRTLLAAVVLLNLELLAVLFYPGTAGLRPTAWWNVLLAFVWIDAGLLALYTSGVPSASARRRLVAGAVGAGYLLVLGAAGGLLRPGAAFGGAPATGFDTAWVIPGWGPEFVYAGEYVHLLLQPYAVVGYVALAYLLYVTVLNAAGAAVSGVLGLLTCVSCTWPVLYSLAAGAFGGTSGVAAATLDNSYLLSTLVFLATVGLLYYRPTLRSA